MMDDLETYIQSGQGTVKQERGGSGGGGMSSAASTGAAQIRPSISTIREAQKFLAEKFARTRLVAAPYLSAAARRNVYLKLETELPTGSFKVRGALWALAQRMKQGEVREVGASKIGRASCRERV